MNVFLWLLAGALLGWLACKFLGKNAERGTMVAVIIGAAGAFFGGQVLAPMFGHVPIEAAEFRPFALLLACVAAVTVLSLTDMLYDRFRI